MSSRFRIIALWCWYRGERFHGYQRQNDPLQGTLRSVQGELLRAFSAAALPRNPVVAGRTDKGVSARMQVLSCRLNRDAPVERVAERLNAHLPDDLRVHLVREARSGFHAAWSACRKEYRYLLPHAPTLDLSRLREVAALIPGTRDFRAFHFKSSEVRLRTVTQVDVTPHPAGVQLRFLGEGFARHMVRMLVAAMEGVAIGTLELDTVRAGLLHQQFFHCPTAPAEPLTLWEVAYPLELDPFTPDERAATVFGFPA
jgi:tRNA pseudouridine38-40 synthase